MRLQGTLGTAGGFGQWQGFLFFSIIIIPQFLFIFCITMQFQGNVWFLTYSDGIK